MTRTFTLAALIAALAAPASATRSHNGKHADAEAIGYPSEGGAVDRTITVSMRDAPDGTMAFDPGDIAVQEGETLRIVLRNDGSVAHEFVRGTPGEIADHLAVMRGVSDMDHDAAFAARLDPGKAGTLIWTFANEGAFAYACLIPGHHGAGIHGRLTVD